MAEEPTTSGSFTKGLFPRFPLSRVVEIPRAIFEIGHGERVRRRLVFEKLGRSADSGTSKSLIATANFGYGLIQGNSGSEHLELTARGRKYVTEQTEEARREVVHDALFSSDIFSAFVDRFRERLVPHDQVAADYLVDQHGMSPADAEACYRVLKQNLTDHGLIQESGGKLVVVSRTVAAESLSTDSEPAPPAPAITAADAPLEAQAGRGVPSAPVLSGPSVRESATRSIPQIHFNIQIVVPENATAEAYENIFRSISVHLLRHDEK